MAHLLAVVLALVRQHVDDEQAAAGLEHARGLGERRGRRRQMVQHEHHRRGVERRVVDRQRLELAAAQLDVGQLRSARARGGQHLVRRVDADDVRDVRRERRQQRAGAAAEIADDPVGRQQPSERLQARNRGRTARRAGDPTAPPTRRRTPATSRCGAASTRASRRASCSAPDGRRPAARVSCQSCARGPSGAVERERVVPARAVAARRHPAGVGQRLQVAADRRLRQLQHGAELGHRQLVALEQQQHAAAGRVGQRGERIEDGRGGGRHISVNPD